MRQFHSLALRWHVLQCAPPEGALGLSCTLPLGQQTTCHRQWARASSPARRTVSSWSHGQGVSRAATPSGRLLLLSGMPPGREVIRAGISRAATIPSGNLSSARPSAREVTECGYPEGQFSRTGNFPGLGSSRPGTALTRLRRVPPSPGSYPSTRGSAAVATTSPLSPRISTLVTSSRSAAALTAQLISTSEPRKVPDPTSSPVASTTTTE